jgi:peptide subunit release factor 1 (eRF1)
VPQITEAVVKDLAGFRSPDAPVLSCYLDIDGRRQITRQAVEREFESLAREASARPDGASLQGDLRRIGDYVSGDLDRSGVRGLAVFSCVAHDLWEVVALPVPVANQLHVNQGPAVAQLEAIVQELEPLGLLLVDRQRARMFVYQLGELVDRTELFEQLPRNDYDRHDEADRGGDERARQHLDEATHQHLRHAADVAFRLFQDHGFTHLAVGAPDELSGQVESLLHPYLRERYCGRVALGAAASDADVRDAALAVEQRLERATEAEVVQRLRDAIGADGPGRSGLAPTLGALAERRVETLVVSQGFTEPGWRCPTCGNLFAKGPSCPVDSSAMAHLDDVVEEAVQQALGQGSRVEVCVGNADIDVLGRIGALLRY